MKKTEILSYGLYVRSQIHTWHFQTHSYAEHKALDWFYTDFLELFDTFVETYQGIFDRVRVSKEYHIMDYVDIWHTKSFLAEYIWNLKALKTDIWDDYSDLQNIIDEMIWLWNQTLYLLSLK